MVRENRHFLRRVVTWLCRNGVTQFLDLGSGIPTVGNVHEVAARITPEAKVAYVDSEPVAVAYSARILEGNQNTTITHADLRDAETVLSAPTVAGLLDFSRPVALMMLGVLGHVGDDGAARSIVRELAGALPPGSYLTLSDGANTSRARQQAHERYAQTGAVPYRLRSPEQIAAFFDGLDLLEPGVVPVSQWRPDPRDADRSGPPAAVDTFGGMARKR